MSPETYRSIYEAQQARCEAEARVKNDDYAQEVDVLWNFFETAKRLNKTPLESWGTHFLKHEFAIERYCRQGSLASEPIEGRITDAINYLFLLRAIIEDPRTQAEPEPFNEEVLDSEPGPSLSERFLGMARFLGRDA